MECRAAIFFLLILQALNGQSDISFMRFYKNDKDFISDLRLLATDRFQRSHLQVFYDSNKNLVIIGKLSKPTKLLVGNTIMIELSMDF